MPPEEGQWEPLDVQRIAKQAADSIEALYSGGPDTFPMAGMVERIIKNLLLEERAYFERVLKDPKMVRINIMRGGIARPSDLVWLFDTDGPVAEKVRKAVEEQIEKDAVILEKALEELFSPSPLANSYIPTAVQAIRKQKRKK